LSTTDGLHTPGILFDDVAGKAGTLPPAQTVNDVPKLNVGATIGLTVTANVIGKAHCPASGVKLYVPEFWLSIVDGLQVPVILLSDVLTNAGTAAPSQTVNDVPKLNVGVMFDVIVTVNVVVVAHCPAVGVKV
jgi:hypothetical protein